MSKVGSEITIVRGGASASSSSSGAEFMDPATAAAVAAASTSSQPPTPQTASPAATPQPSQPVSGQQPVQGRFIIRPKNTSAGAATLPAASSPASPQIRLEVPGQSPISNAASDLAQPASPSLHVAPSVSVSVAAAETGATPPQEELSPPSAVSPAAAAAGGVTTDISPRVHHSSASRDSADSDDGDGFPAGMIRPPTPPRHSTRESPTPSRRVSDSAGVPDSSPLLLHPSAAASASAAGTSSSSRPRHAPAMSFDVSGSEFSYALRAALTDTASGAGGNPSSVPAAMRRKSPRIDSSPIPGSVDENSGAVAASSDETAGAATPASCTTPAPPLDETTEREQRKQALRQKNAMHMRIRNASVSQASALTSGNRRAGNATNMLSPSGKDGIGTIAENAGMASIRNSPARGVQRSMTAFSAEKGADLAAAERDGFVPSTQPTSLAAFLMGSTPKLMAIVNSAAAAASGSANDASVTSAPKRTLSSILKPTAASLTVPSSPNAAPKRQQSGILRSPSMHGSKGGLATVAQDAAAASANAAPTVASAASIGPAVQRTATASKMRKPSEGGELSSSTDSDDDSDDERPGMNGANAAVAAAIGSPAAAASTADNDGRQSLRGNKSVAFDASSDELPPGSTLDAIMVAESNAGRGRKNVFVNQGGRLMMRSVSTVTGSRLGSSHQAASVMVLSVSSIFNRLRLYTDLCFALALVGVLLTIVNKELHYNYPTASSDGPYRNVWIGILVVRCLTSLSTMLLMFCLYRYYQADFNFLQLNRVYLLRSAFWNTQSVYAFLAECAICLIHEPPFLNHDVDLSVTDSSTLLSASSHYSFQANAVIPAIIVRNPWSLLVAFRFYLFLRLILSRYYTGGTKILGLWFNFSFNPAFAIRNILYSHPLLSLLPVVGTLIFSCSYALWVFEREAPDRQFTFGTALWVILITITAVGYGDVTPLTSGGRAICIISAFIGIVTSAVLVAAVHQKLTLLPYEGRMVEFLERDSNSTALKFHAARCIGRSWKYYHYRRRCVKMLAARKFGFVARTNLLRHKTVMLQGIFDFQTARKQIQAYDRRYHSEQLFRSMLEGLYDKLESMTLDFHVLEDELDLSYEEQRKMTHKQSEILDEVRKGGGAGSGASPKTATESIAAPGAAATTDAKSPDQSDSSKGDVAPPKEKRIPSSMRRKGSAIQPTTAATTAVAPLDSPSALSAAPQDSPGPTRPGTSFLDHYQSGRISAIDSQLDPPGGEQPPRIYRNGGHKSVRNSQQGPDDEAFAAVVAGSAAGVAALPVVAPITVPVVPSAVLQTGPASPAAATNAANASAATVPSATRDVNPRRASTLGTLDLVAAAAAVKASHQQQGSAPASATAAAARGKSHHDLLTDVTVETPRGVDNLGYLGTSTLTLRASMRTPLTRPGSIPPSIDAPLVGGGHAHSHSVTSDLLSVVESVGSEMPPPAGRIRFGEVDFAAHRAAPAVRPNRGTIMLQRGKTMDRGLSVGGSTALGDPHAHAGLLSQRGGLPRPGSIELPVGNPSFGGLDTPGSAGSSSLGNDLAAGRAAFLRQPSVGGGHLRAAANARNSMAGASGAGAGGIDQHQFERMMAMMGQLVDKVSGLEAQISGGPGSANRSGNASPLKPASGQQQAQQQQSSPKMPPLGYRQMSVGNTHVAARSSIAPSPSSSPQPR